MKNKRFIFLISWVLAVLFSLGAIFIIKRAVLQTDSDGEKNTYFSEINYVAFGDSITVGADHNNGYEPMENPYPKLVGEILGLKSVKNLASSGATFCSNDRGNVCMTDRVLEYSGEAEIISVWLGFNDWARTFPLGSIEDNTTETIYGCLNLMGENLTANHKDAFVFFITPYKTALIRNDEYTLPDVVKAIEEVAKIYGIPVLDMYNNGNFESEMYEEYSDGVHPTQEFVTNHTAPEIARFIEQNYEKTKER